MQFRRIGQLVAATTVSAVALSGAQAVAQENKTIISVTNITDIHGHLEDKIGDPAKAGDEIGVARLQSLICLLYTSPSPRDRQKSRMPSSA